MILFRGMSFRGVPGRCALAVGIAGSILMSLVGAVPAEGAVPSAVSNLYDPLDVTVVDLRMSPLAGWIPPVDCDSTPDDPNCPADWSTLTTEEKAAFIDNQARAAAWDVVRFDTTNSIELPAVLSIDGGADMNVKVRRKSSRALPSETDPRKVGLKVDLPKGNIYGVTKLSLENGGDVSPIAEGLAWNLHQQATGTGFYPDGYDPALANWANVSVNGDNLGVYTSVEQRNRQFLANRGWAVSDPTWLYEGDDVGFPVVEQGPTTTDGSITPSPTSSTLCYEPFVPANTQCPTPSDYDLSVQLPATIDMTSMLTQAAVDAFSANNDALISKGKNYHFVDRTGDKRRYFPWDLDAVFRGSPTDASINIYSTSATVNRRSTSYTQSAYQGVILNHPTFRRQFNTIMLGLLDGPLGPTVLSNFLDSILTEEMRAAFAADPYVSAVIGPSLDDHITKMKAWISQRSTAVRSQVQANVPVPRADFSVPRAATQLAIGLPSPARIGTTVTFTSALTSGGSGVAGVQVSLVFNKTTYRAITNSQGVASWSIKLPTKAGTYSVSSSFAGDTNYSPASASSSLSVTR